jgi:hemoglobin
MGRQIKDIEDIEYLVDTFYGKVREDELLKDIFNEVIKDRWPEHLNKMYRFWETVLLGNHTYQGSPFVPHAKLPVEKQHFNRWLKLFYETVDENFIGEVADQAKWRGERMAEMFLTKIDFFRNNPSSAIL